MSEENRHRDLIRVRHQLQGTLGEKIDDGTWAWFQYRVQDAVRGGSGQGTVGERKLEVLGFVEEKHANRGRRPPFGELLEVWNSEHPHWAYTDYRALSKAYREAYQEVFRPRYQTPNAENAGPETDAAS